MEKNDGRQNFQIFGEAKEQEKKKDRHYAGKI